MEVEEEQKLYGSCEHFHCQLLSLSPGRGRGFSSSVLSAAGHVSAMGFQLQRLLLLATITGSMSTVQGNLLRQIGSPIFTVKSLRLLVSTKCCMCRVWNQCSAIQTASRRLLGKDRSRKTERQRRVALAGNVSDAGESIQDSKQLKPPKNFVNEGRTLFTV